jgi:hypothetical protein
VDPAPLRLLFCDPGGFNHGSDTLVVLLPVFHVQTRSLHAHRSVLAIYFDRCSQELASLLAGLFGFGSHSRDCRRRRDGSATLDKLHAV